MPPLHCTDCGTATERPEPRCACVSSSPYACWGRRYDLPRPWTRSAIEWDGGPCECACHERFYDDEDESTDPHPHAQRHRGARGSKA